MDKRLAAELEVAIATLLRVKAQYPAIFAEAMQYLTTTQAQPLPPEIAPNSPVSANPKGSLQTFTQQNGLPLPEYEVHRAPTGAAHCPIHHQVCRVKLADGRVLEAFGSDRVRKQAEKIAATEMLSMLKQVVLAPPVAQAPWRAADPPVESQPCPVKSEPPFDWKFEGMTPENIRKLCLEEHP